MSDMITSAPDHQPVSKMGVCSQQQHRGLLFVLLEAVVESKQQSGGHSREGSLQALSCILAQLSAVGLEAMGQSPKQRLVGNDRTCWFGNDRALPAGVSSHSMACSTDMEMALPCCTLPFLSTCLFRCYPSWWQ